MPAPDHQCAAPSAWLFARFRLILAAVLLFHSSAAFAAESSPLDAQQPTPSTVGPLAVIGFQLGSDVDDRDNWMPIAIEEALADRLRRVPGLITLPPVRAHQARREIAGESGPQPDWRAVLDSLGVVLHVHGRVDGDPDRARLTLSLDRFDAQSREELFGPDRLFRVLDLATAWLVRELRPDIAHTPGAAWLAPPADSVSAVEFHARAIAAARKRDAGNVIFMLRMADQYDPAHAPSQLMFAEVESRLRDADARREATMRLRRLLRIARERNDPGLEAAVELAQAGLILADRSFDAAAARVRRAAELAESAGDLYARISALNAAIDVLMLQANLADASPRQAADLRRQAAEALNELITLFESIGDRISICPTASRLALLLESAGEDQAAIRHHLQALAACESAGARGGQASALMFISQWHRRHRQWAEAIDAARRCLELAPGEMRPHVQIALGGALEADRQLRPALDAYRAALASLMHTEDLPNQLVCLMGIADLHAELGDKPAALRALQDAIDVAHVLESPIAQELRDKRAALAAQP